MAICDSLVDRSDASVVLQESFCCLCSRKTASKDIRFTLHQLLQKVQWGYGHIMESHPGAYVNHKKKDGCD